MDEAPVQSETPLDLAAPVSRRVQLDAVFLAGCRAMRSPDQFPEGEHVTLNNKIVNLEVGLVEDSDKFFLKILLSTEAVNNRKDTDNILFTIEATFILNYEVPSRQNFEDKNLHAFAATNGVFNVWPYWREYVQSTTTRMGLPPITLPVFRV